jgi:phosphoribosylaminoimidazole carboxylase (NCAIR synthetase)
VWLECLDVPSFHAEIRKQRKMGHITVVGQSIVTVREKIRAVIGNDVPASWSLENISTENLRESQG